MGQWGDCYFLGFVPNLGISFLSVIFEENQPLELGCSSSCNLVKDKPWLIVDQKLIIVFAKVAMSWNLLSNEPQNIST